MRWLKNLLATGKAASQPRVTLPDKVPYVYEGGINKYFHRYEQAMIRIGSVYEWMLIEVSVRLSTVLYSASSNPSWT